MVICVSTVWSVCVVITFVEYFRARKRGFAGPMDKPVLYVLTLIIYAPLIAFVFVLMRLGDYGAKKFKK